MEDGEYILTRNGASHKSGNKIVVTKVLYEDERQTQNAAELPCPATQSCNKPGDPDDEYRQFCERVQELEGVPRA
jgi:hypothetical protein